MSTKKIEHQKFTQLPHQISNGPPLTTYNPRAPILYIFVLFASPKTATFAQLFYTFSYFIPTFPKILVPLPSYFSTQGCQKAWRIKNETIGYSMANLRREKGQR
jgi:hypothetical protein